ncbi:hypothetical protein Y032_0093g2666 [Ancylostoma ceylanicum]|uniref:Uncharacterized protein n=1 Tax=Ancylostoma ceylanicum TaxID=53326 RepID=A0A016TM35_9BILA|nr:hypothetical protein Y032_0093g2666 [Ancylostoma ceylanicum]
MVRRATGRANNVENTTDEMPFWASKLIDSFNSYAGNIERSLSQTFERVFGYISDLQQKQNSILDRLSSLETKISAINTSPAVQQGCLYSAMVKIRADSSKIDEKLRTITWVGIDEKVDERSTCRFDREIVKEAVYTSGCEDLIREYEEGRITIRRHPSGSPRGPGKRGRIIKITLANQSFRDSLLSHLRSGRQSLTQQFVHSFARRDYTMEELTLDRSLRKQAGDLNAQAGKLVYVVRDFDIVKLKNPRELPRRQLTSYSSGTTVDKPRTHKPTALTQSTTLQSSASCSSIRAEEDAREFTQHFSSASTNSQCNRPLSA